MIVIHTLKMWQHYLLGKKFLLMIYHHSLTNYFKQPTMNARQARWIDFLSEFDFDIKHLKGKEKQVVDALSRKINCIYEVSFSEAHTTFKEHIKEKHKIMSIRCYGNKRIFQTTTNNI